MEIQKIERHDRTLWLNIALIVVFFAVMSLGIYLVRDKLLYNANEMGNNLAQSYSREEETRISIYEMLLNMCSLYTDTSIDNDDPAQTMQEGLAEYTEYMSQVLGAEIIDPYAVVDGKIVAAHPWDGNEDYDYTQKEWYTNALAANGKIVFTDVYTDAITGKKLVTMSVKLHGEGNVLAFDILMDNFHVLKNKVELPEGSAYYLFDRSGHLIYLAGEYSLEDEGVQQYAQELLAGVRDGSFESHTASIRGLDEVIMCFREIDVKKKKELRQRELLEQALENAKRAASKKTMFFSNMSHDMRTPLNAISGMTRLARQHVQDPARVQEYLDKIDTSGRQLTALVNDILDMARLEQGGESTLNCQPVNLVQCVQETSDLFREQAQQENRQYEAVLDVQDPMVNADAFRLNQILNNLLSNAFKYSREGDRIRLELKQAARRENRGQYQIIVEDTGLGMSESFLEHLFEPFARETVFAPTRITGTGLGLPIVKGLVQQMSGEITVQSKLGEGSRFVVSLPLQIVEAPAAPEPSLKEVEPFTLEGKRMIVAEDNELNMEITTEFLSMMGVDVLQAWNEQEAVERFSREKEGSVDAILMDMQMPVMDGCTACRQIRAMERADAAKVPIIAVTANAFAEDIAKTTEAGMNAHISKPIDFKLLSDLLQKLAQ